MSSDGTVKILAVGSVNGLFSKFFKKINTINSKNGPFEMVVCTGDFFCDSDRCRTEWQQALEGRISVDVPVYVLGPSTSKLTVFYGKKVDSDGEELCKNVMYLGRKGFFKLMDGLKIAYISNSDKKSIPDIELNDAKAITRQIDSDDKYVGVDLFLSSVWPKDITKYIKTDIPEIHSSIQLARLVARLKPRYHLSAHPNRFFERPPYRNHKVLVSDQKHVTRFISVAPFNNKESEKAIYAFSIKPLERMQREELIKQPNDVTEIPFKFDGKQAEATKLEEEDDTQQFFFSEQKRGSDGKDGGRAAKRVAKGAPKFEGPCWFCLGSKEVEKHLVVSVGNLCYLTLPKGGVNEDNVMICPISHHNSTVVLPDDARLELEKFKRALKKMFKAEGKGMIIYERNFYTQHLQLQVHGIDSEIAADARDCFCDLAESQEMEMIDVPEDKDISELVALTTPYFCVNLDDGQRLLHKVKGRMPIQFGREVITCPSLLNAPDRVNWKDCALTKDEEVQATKKFRKRFAKYDFNLEEED